MYISLIWFDFDLWIATLTEGQNMETENIPRHFFVLLFPNLSVFQKLMIALSNNKDYN